MRRVSGLLWLPCLSGWPHNEGCRLTTSANAVRCRKGRSLDLLRSNDHEFVRRRSFTGDLSLTRVEALFGRPQ
jgi:hypothetical protein